jgi:aminotransferase
MMSDTAGAKTGTNEEINIFALQELAARSPDAISLGLGDPDLPTPAHIVAAARDAFESGRAGPLPARGLPELRQAVAAKLKRVNGINVDPDREVLITTGSQEALFLLVQALIDPGDEVIVPDPRYPSYDAAIDLAGGKIVLTPTDEANDFDLNPEEVEARITSRTKAILLITPSNPTAGIISPENLQRLAGIAIAHDLIVIADEIYEHFVYDGAQHLSIASLPGMSGRTITLNGFSKSYAMTGWRVGYIAAPGGFIDAVTGLKSAINRHAPAVSQWAAVAALEGPQDCIAEMRALYDSRRHLVMNALTDMGLSFGQPRGAFYIWANISSTGIEATMLSYLLLRDAGVLVFPGTGFGENWGNYMRFTLLQPEAVLEDAMERIAKVLRG